MNAAFGIERPSIGAEFSTRLATEAMQEFARFDPAGAIPGLREAVREQVQEFATDPVMLARENMLADLRASADRIAAVQLVDRLERRQAIADRALGAESAPLSLADIDFGNDAERDAELAEALRSIEAGHYAASALATAVASQELNDAASPDISDIGKISLLHRTLAQRDAATDALAAIVNLGGGAARASKQEVRRAYIKAGAACETFAQAAIAVLLPLATKPASHYAEQARIKQSGAMMSYTALIAFALIESMLLGVPSTTTVVPPSSADRADPMFGVISEAALVVTTNAAIRVTLSAAGAIIEAGSYRAMARYTRICQTPAAIRRPTAFFQQLRFIWSFLMTGWEVAIAAVRRSSGVEFRQLMADASNRRFEGRAPEAIVANPRPDYIPLANQTAGELYIWGINQVVSLGTKGEKIMYVGPVTVAPVDTLQQQIHVDYGATIYDRLWILIASAILVPLVAYYGGGVLARAIRGPSSVLADYVFAGNPDLPVPGFGPDDDDRYRSASNSRRSIVAAPAPQVSRSRDDDDSGDERAVASPSRSRSRGRR